MPLKRFKINLTKNKKQAGFLLPLALFMIVVSSGVALVLLEEVVKPSSHLTTSATGAKSAYAAKVGAELAVNQLFFPVTSPVADRQQMDIRCESVNVNPASNVDGLNQCSLIVSCECRYENNSVCDSSNVSNYNSGSGIENSFYRIQSEARCGAGFAQGYARFEITKKAP